MDIKIYADGAVMSDMIDAYKTGLVSGFTTNPSLMKKAGISDYISFAHIVLQNIPDLPISFEVFADDLATMEQEARKIHNLGDNVFVKIPIQNTRGESAIPLIKKLSAAGIALNVTAILTVPQVEQTVHAFAPGTKNIVSVFAGRIADTGRNPVPYMSRCVSLCDACPEAELLWASSREVINVFQAEELGVDIITCTPAIINHLKNTIGKSLAAVSLDTVKGFNKDIQSLGFSIL